MHTLPLFLHSPSFRRLFPAPLTKSLPLQYPSFNTILICFSSRNKVAHARSVEGKTMSAMLSTRYLLLALLAVMSGRTVGEMTCDNYYPYGPHAYDPKDVHKCWSPDINGILGGKLDGCSNGFVSIRYSCGCLCKARVLPNMSYLEAARCGFFKK